MRPKEDTVAINYKIKREIFKSLFDFCEERNISKTSVIEEALKKYIAEKLEDEELIKQYRFGKIEFIEKNN